MCCKGSVFLLRDPTEVITSVHIKDKKSNYTLVIYSLIVYNVGDQKRRCCKCNIRGGILFALKRS